MTQEHPLWFREHNYEYRDAHNRTHPFYDFIITRLCFVPLMLLSLYFFWMNLFYFYNGLFSLPFWFQNITLILLLLVILNMYPQQTLVISNSSILFQQNTHKDILLPFTHIQSLYVSKAKDIRSFLPYHTLLVIDKNNNSFEFRTTRIHTIISLLPTHLQKKENINL